MFHFSMEQFCDFGGHLLVGGRRQVREEATFLDFHFSFWEAAGAGCWGGELAKFLPSS